MVDSPTPSGSEGLLTTRMFWLESPTNPAMGDADRETIDAAAHASGVVVVDNTFATPSASFISQRRRPGRPLAPHVPLGTPTRC